MSFDLRGADVADYREFELDRSVASAALSPRRLVPALLGCALFTAAGIVMLLFDPELGAKIVAIADIVFFGGGGLLALVIAAFRPSFGVVSRLRIDRHGITWITGSKPLAPFGLGVRRVSAPWSSVADLSVIDSASVPSFVRSGLVFEFVGVVPNDFEAFVQPLGRVRSFGTRTIFQQIGAIVAGPVAGLSSPELLALMERYRNRAA